MERARLVCPSFQNDAVKVWISSHQIAKRLVQHDSLYYYCSLHYLNIVTLLMSIWRRGSWPAKLLSSASRNCGIDTFFYFEDELLDGRKGVAHVGHARDGDHHCPIVVNPAFAEIVASLDADIEGGGEDGHRHATSYFQ
jgi:hypothetical protein